MRRLFVIAVVLIHSCMSTFGFADNPFSGLYIGADAGSTFDYTDTEATYSYQNLFAATADGLDVDRTRASSGKTDDDVLAKVNLDYNHGLDDNWLFGVGASYFFRDEKIIDSGVYLFSNPNNRADFPRAYSVATQIEPITHLAIAVKPGYVPHFNRNLLFYGSVAYHHMKANVSTATRIDHANIDVNAVITDMSQKKIFQGLGLGGGIRYRIDERWSYNVFAEWIGFEKESMNGPGISSTQDEITLAQSVEIESVLVNIAMGLTYQF